MLYTFIGGPMAGKSINVPEDRLTLQGKYTHVEWGEYSDPFTMLPPMTLHQYLPVGNIMNWIEPDEMIK
jgi:hypothetical protein